MIIGNSVKHKVGFSIDKSVINRICDSLMESTKGVVCMSVWRSVRELVNQKIIL